MGKVLIAALAGVVLLPVTAQADYKRYSYAQADDIGYSYVDLAYVDASIDAGPDGDGYEVGISVKVHPNVHVFGNYQDLSFDPFLGIGVDTTIWDVGAGWNGGLGERADFVARAGYVDAEADTLGFTVSDDGYEVIVGVRGMVLSKLELDGFVEYVDLSDSGDDTVFQVKILYNITNVVAIGAGYETNDADLWHAGVRIYWGK